MGMVRHLRLARALDAADSAWLDALALARVRAQYQVRMPDAVALHAALVTRSRLATFDTGLAAAAHRAGISTVGIE
jgi:predicted nucleic acid-binding protein